MAQLFVLRKNDVSGLSGHLAEAVLDCNGKK